jgi:GT2 family glycosyltransferase
MKPVLTIAIPTYNNPHQLVGCLNSIIGYTEFPYKIIVINNGEKGSLDPYFEGSKFSNYQFIEPGENLGWVGGINRALEDCDTEFFCLLNDDVVFIPGDPTFWRRLIVLFQDPEVGYVGPASDYISGIQNIHHFCLSPVIEANYLINVCTIVRTEEFRSMGGLDAELPGGDDFDLSIRYVKAGKKLLVVRHVFLHHIGQQSGRKVFGEYYDSLDMQEAVNNALIRKHGLKAWFTATSGEVQNYWRSPTFSEDYDNSRWVDESLEEFKGSTATGLNLGAGAVRLEGVSSLNVDERESGQVGTGGTKGIPADTDIVADICSVPLPDESQDFLVASHVLEHVADCVQALQEWKRLLKPGGKLIVTVPDNNKVPGMIIDSSHLHAFTLQSLQNLLETLDWEILKGEDSIYISVGIVARKKVL